MKLTYTHTPNPINYEFDVLSREKWTIICSCNKNFNLHGMDYCIVPTVIWEDRKKKKVNAMKAVAGLKKSRHALDS